MTTTYRPGPIEPGTETTYPELGPGPHLADRSTEETLSVLERLPGMDNEALDRMIDAAAQKYGTLALWRELPREHQGYSPSALAWRYRDQHQAASRLVWLAARAEHFKRFGW